MKLNTVRTYMHMSTIGTINTYVHMLHSPTVGTVNTYDHMLHSSTVVTYSIYEHGGSPPYLPLLLSICVSTVCLCVPCLSVCPLSVCVSPVCMCVPCLSVCPMSVCVSPVCLCVPCLYVCPVHTCTCWFSAVSAVTPGPDTEPAVVHGLIIRGEYRLEPRAAMELDHI
jgi:hypothetical protein